MVMMKVMVCGDDDYGGGGGDGDDAIFIEWLLCSVTLKGLWKYSLLFIETLFDSWYYLYFTGEETEIREANCLAWRHSLYVKWDINLCLPETGQCHVSGLLPPLCSRSGAHPREHSCGGNNFGGNYVCVCVCSFYLDSQYVLIHVTLL